MVGGKPAVCSFLDAKGRMHCQRKGVVSTANALQKTSEIHPFIQLFNRYILSTCYVPGTVLGLGIQKQIQQTKFPALRDLTFQIRMQGGH